MFTIFSVKWYLHSVFQRWRSSLRTCKVWFSWPRLMMSQASENLWNMLFCIWNGISQNLRLLPSCWGGKQNRKSLETSITDYFNIKEKSQQRGRTGLICRFISCSCQERIASKRQIQILIFPTNINLSSSLHSVELRSWRRSRIKRGLYWSSTTERNEERFQTWYNWQIYIKYWKDKQASCFFPILGGVGSSLLFLFPIRSTVYRISNINFFFFLAEV